MMDNSYFLSDSPERVERLLWNLDNAVVGRWQPHRIIFRNFWLLQSEEFIWHHGRLLLGGQNAAGKSTVLTMAVPILLDGNKGEDRLNTFGGQGRHMAYYVTGTPPGEEGDGATYYYPSRTSYMALEFRRRSERGEPEFLTIGQGLHHDRTADEKQVRSWGFVVTDGRRIGRPGPEGTFDLVRENGISLGRPDLKRLLGAGGELYETNREYERAVNRLLFGFREIEEYRDLIDLLVKVRRPKLTKEIRPRDVAELLTESLPALSPAVMQQTAEALDNIDQTTTNIEGAEREIQAAQAFEKATASVFRRRAELAAAELLVKARAADQAESERAKAQSEHDEAATTLATSRKALAEADGGLTDLAAEEASLRQEHTTTFNAVAEVQRLKDAIVGDEESEREISKELTKQEAELTKAKRAEQKGLADWQQCWADGKDLVQELRSTAEEAEWPATDGWVTGASQLWKGLRVAAVRENLAGELPSRAVTAAAKERQESIRAVENALRSLQAAETEQRAAVEREQEAHQAVLEADSRVAESAESINLLRQAAADVVEGVLLKAPVAVSAEARDVIGRALQTFPYGATERPTVCLEPAWPFFDAERENLHQLKADAQREVVERKQQLTVVTKEWERLQEALPEPERSPIQLAARTALEAHGISYAALFEAVELIEDVEDGVGAQVEAVLTEMGLLDALLVSPSERDQALAILKEQGLGERFLSATRQGEKVVDLTALLEPDPAHPMAEAVAEVLSAVSLDGSTVDREVLWIAESGSWRHGILIGQAAPSTAVRFLGRSARERFRQSELARLQAYMDELRTFIAAAKERVLELDRGLEALRKARVELEGLSILADLDRASSQYRDAKASQSRVQEAFGKALGATLSAKARVERAHLAYLDSCRPIPEAQGRTLEGLAQLHEAVSHLATGFERLAAQARYLQGEWAKLEMQASTVTLLEGHVVGLANQVDQLAVDLRTKRSTLAGLERRLADPSAEALFRRLDQIESLRTELTRQRDGAGAAVAIAGDRLARAEENLPRLGEAAQEAASQAAEYRRVLAERVGAYPTLAAHREGCEDLAGARRVAEGLLSRFQERAGLVSEIQSLLMRDQGELSKVYAERRAALREYSPEYEAEDQGNRLVTFQLDGQRLLPYQLLGDLQERAGRLSTLLQAQEAALFEQHLLREVGREVRRSLLQADDWVEDVNRLLKTHPLRNGEQVELVWEPKRTEAEVGSLLARVVDLIRRDEGALNEAQRAALQHAFREEVRQIREQARRDEWRADIFREKLHEALDYRNWFRFRLFVRGGVGGRAEITDAAHNAKSGSERALVLLLPLLAGLAVRYEGAAAWAPRMLALDEGFAGIDAANTRQLLRFLVALNFDWVISSEKPPALTEELSGASIYALLRAGTVVATRPSFWYGDRQRDWDGLVDGDQYDVG